jgi:uncharacterized glyoxalase superfamily protein PhnB
LVPYFVVRGAVQAIEFYKAVFGATELLRMPSPDGKKIGHAELKIRGHVLMLADENPQMGAVAPQLNGPPPPVGLMFYSDNVDALYHLALSRGAKGLMPPTDMFWGDRYGKFLDPFGHLWSVATHIKDVSPAEMAKGAEEWSRKNAAPA